MVKFLLGVLVGFILFFPIQVYWVDKDGNCHVHWQRYKWQKCFEANDGLKLKTRR